MLCTMHLKVTCSERLKRCVRIRAHVAITTSYYLSAPDCHDWKVTRDSQ